MNFDGPLGIATALLLLARAFSALSSSAKPSRVSNGLASYYFSRSCEAAEKLEAVWLIVDAQIYFSPFLL